MDFISGLGSGVIGYIIPFLFVLTVVVFFHELGHFLVARWCGVRISAFSVGFGPELIGRYDRHGTRWKLCAIPLGGYVKFAGDENAASVPDREALEAVPESERAGLFAFKPVWQRAAVVAAGPFANFILSISIFALIFMLVGKPITEARVDKVDPAGAAAAAGIRPGDRIVSVGGSAIDSFGDLQRIVSASAGVPLTIGLDRGGTPMTLSVTPAPREITDRFGNVQKVGLLGIERSIEPGDVRTRHYGPLEAIGAGAAETWFIIARTGDYLAGVVTGRESPDQLGGPIRVAQVSGQVATLGVLALINLVAVLSVSIGLLNLLPVPMLDGGHLAFYAAEAVRGRPLSARAQDIGFRIGLAFVLFLMVFATWNDLTQILFRKAG
ncbi:RIP metalloprotease RseP [Segnochrobactraceae bacterium EtOH-i3]